MVLVHHHRDVRKLVHSRLHHRPQERRTRVFAGTGAGLHDHRRIGLVRCLHNGPGLFQVVDIEGGHTVIVLGGVWLQARPASPHPYFDATGFVFFTNLASAKAQGHATTTTANPAKRPSAA